MSQKRMKGTPTRADGQVMTYREAIFAVINAAARVLSQSIDMSFDKTKYGSRRNNFFKRNYQYFEAWAQAPIGTNANQFTNVLKSFGMQEGQTVVAALQAGIIDISGVEIAMQQSIEGETYGFMAFAEWSANTTSNASYIRADIQSQYVVNGANEGWNLSNDPAVIPIITSMIGNSSESGDQMKMISIEVTGRNLLSLKDEKTVIKTSTGLVLKGSWNENCTLYTFDAGESGYTVGIGQTARVQIWYDGRQIAETTFYGQQSGVSGE